MDTTETTSEITIKPAPVLDMSRIRTVPPHPPLPAPPRDKWDREYQAFLDMKSRLLQTHDGLYVAVHDGNVVETGPDKLAVLQRAYERHGYVPIFVGLVTDKPIPVLRVPSPREISARE